METVLAVFTLGAAGAGTDKAGRYIEQFPSYIYATAVNADAANAADATDEGGYGGESLHHHRCDREVAGGGEPAQQ